MLARTTGWRIGAAGAAVALAGTILGACGSGSGVAADDVSVSTCGPNVEGGNPSSTGRVHNSTSHSSSYFITIDFVAPSGTVVGQGKDAIGSLGSGASAVWSTTSDRPAQEPFTCKVTSVQRTATP